MRPRVRLVSRWTSAGARTKCVFRLIFFHCPMSVVSSRSSVSSVTSSPTVRTMTPPESFGQHFLDLRAQPLPLLALADLPAHADALGERHVDEEAAGERDLRGDARSLRGDRLLGDLNDQVLAALQDVLNRRGLRATSAPRGVRASRRRSSSSSSSSSPRRRDTRDRTRGGTRSSPSRCRRTRPECPGVLLRPVRGKCRRPCGALRDGRPEVQRAGRPRGWRPASRAGSR